MFIRGAVFFDKTFVYDGGSIGKKLLVLLNSPQKGENLLVVKTTSQQKTRPATAGCISNHHRAYHLQQNKDFFQEPTWIQLDDWFQFANGTLEKKASVIGQLAPKTIDSVVSCFLKINEDDLSPVTKKILVPPLTQGIMALAGKFNKR